MGYTNAMKSISILGTRIDALSEFQLQQHIQDHIVNHHPTWITTLNPEIIVYAQNNPEYKTKLNQADINLADGVGLTAAAIFQTLPHRNLLTWITTLIQVLKNPQNPKFLCNPIPGDLLVRQLIETANRNHQTIYFLGSSPQTISQLQIKLKHRYPQLNAYYNSGPTDVNQLNDKQNQQLCQHINQAKPDILFVAFGAPKQETWLFQNKQTLTVPIRIGVGGTFDDLAGITANTPDWFRQHGLRWFWRLITQPRRVSRIFTATVTFSNLILRSSTDLD